ncbi:MAG: Crp/Fnr family transcriptional regulator [Pseudonocardiaceae bacterium]
MTTIVQSEAIRRVPTVTVHTTELVIRCLTGGVAGALPADDVAALAAHLVVRKLDSGQVVFGPQDRPDGVWIIRSGAVELMLETGRPRMVAQVLREGDVFGDVPLLTERESPYYSRAACVTICMWLAADDFLLLLAHRPAIARLWLSSCAARFIDSQVRLPGLLEGPLPQRTAALLICEARGSLITLSQATLAAMLGIPRPSVNRVLRAFQRQGLISLSYRRIRILDETRLCDVAHDAPSGKPMALPR